MTEKKTQMYTTLARHYDKMHHFVNYEGQAEQVISEHSKHCQSGGKRVLDVCCGTGIHAGILSKRGFDVTGLDNSPEMLSVAKEKKGKVEYIQGDMKTFKLTESFDLVMCMYNSILYNRTRKELAKTLKNFYDHLKKGGILYFESFEKTRGIERGKFLYELKEKKNHIISVYLTDYLVEENLLVFDNYFIINEKLYHDYHKAGAFMDRDIIEILRETGFEIIKSERINNAFSHTYVARKN